MSAGMGIVPVRRPAAVLPVVPHVPRLIFSTHDRITIGGVSYTGAEAVPGGHILRRVDFPVMTEEFSDDRIWLLSNSRDWVLDPDHFAPETARARIAVGAGGLDDLPVKETPDVVWKWEFCCRFLRAYGAGRTNKSDLEMGTAIATIYAEMRTLDFATVPVVRKGKPTKKASPAGPSGKARKPYAGTKVVVQLRTPPGVRTLHRWLALLEKYGHSPVSLRDGRYRSGCRTPQIVGKALELLVEHGQRYATPERPKIKNLHRDLRAAVRAHNDAHPSEEPVVCPSKNALGLYIAGLGKFFVYAGRYGEERAKRKFAIITSGMVVTRPYERLEIDSWLVDLQSILTVVGLWDRLNGKVRREIKRMHFCAAIDVRTKIIVGANLSESADTAAALAVLRMAVTDKRAYADAAGATLPWNQHASWETLNADGGPQFNNPAFIGRVAALGCSPDFPSGGVPQLRGTMESFFKTVAMQLIARLPGKTFSNVVEKDEYPSEALACIDTPELARLLTRWIVDAYHGTPHDGLAGETPHDAWIRLTRLYGLRKAPDRHKIRAIFGIPLTRTLGNGGIRVLNLRYWCEALEQHFLVRGNVDMEVKLDPEDLGEIAVRIGGAWHVASCVREGFEDVALETWIRAGRQLARTYAKGAAATQPAVDAAIRDAGILTREAMARAGISSVMPTADDIDRAEREVMQGWTMPEQAWPADAGTRADPLDGGIPVTGPDDRPTIGRESDDFEIER